MTSTRRVTVKVHGIQREARFPLRTPARTIALWKRQTRAELELEHPTPVKGTLDAAIALYLTQKKTLVGWSGRRSELRAWSALYGTWPRAKIKAEQVRLAMSTWAEKGVAPKTINNRLTSLQALYRTLDGKRSRTPCDDIERLHVTKTPPITVTADTIRAVATQLEQHEACGWLRTAKTRGRFMVLATTGKRPSELMRAEPGDVDLERQVWIVRDGKGGWGPGIYLNADMLAAWHVFIAADAWGRFRTNSFAERLRKAGWPTHIRPYNLRHTLGIALSEEHGADLSDIQAFLAHKSIRTTRTHYVPVRGSRMQRLSEHLEGRIGWGTAGAPAGEAGKPQEP